MSDIRVDYTVDVPSKKVSGSVTVFIEGNDTSSVELSISLGDKTIFEKKINVDSKDSTKTDFSLEDVKLWYPHGYGDQPLYNVAATLLNKNGDKLDSNNRKTGFRKGELVQTPDRIGKSFYFRINDVDVFCGGSDWIPADSFTPRIAEDRYRKWLKMMVDGYQSMIR